MRQASRILSFCQDKILFYKMLKVAGCKRKLKTRTIEKHKILKEVDKGDSSASISKKYGIAKHALSGWLKEKNKNLFGSQEKQNFCERVRMRVSPYEDLEKACYMWHLNARHQSMPVSGTIFKVKALYFAKKLGCDRWKKRYNVSFKTISGIFSFHQVHCLKYL